MAQPVKKDFNHFVETCVFKPHKREFQCHLCNIPPMKRKYNFALHMGFKHDDWEVMKEWCRENNRIWGGMSYMTAPLKPPPKDIGKNDVFLERRWKCAVCHQPKIYNTTKEYEICQCVKIEGKIDENILKMWYKNTTLRG